MLLNLVHSTYKAILFFVNVLVLPFFAFFARCINTGISYIPYVFAALRGVLLGHGDRRSHSRGAARAVPTRTGHRSLADDDGVSNSDAWATTALLFSQLRGNRHMPTTTTSTGTSILSDPSSLSLPSVLNLAHGSLPFGTGNGSPINDAQTPTSIVRTSCIQSPSFSCSLVTPIPPHQGHFTSKVIAPAAIKSSSTPASTDCLLGEAVARHGETDALGCGQNKPQQDGNATASLVPDVPNTRLYESVRMVDGGTSCPPPCGPPSSRPYSQSTPPSTVSSVPLIDARNNKHHPYTGTGGCEPTLEGIRQSKQEGCTSNINTMDKKTMSGDGATVLTACNPSPTRSSVGPKIIASSTRSSPRATTNTSQSLYRRAIRRHYHHAWNRRDQAKVLITRARGQQAGGNGGGLGGNSHDTRAASKAVKFSLSAKAEDACGMLKKTVCNIVEYDRNRKRRIMKKSVVPLSKARHPTRTSTTPDAAVASTAPGASDFATLTILDDLTFAVRVLQRKMVMGGVVVAKRVKSNQAAPYPSLQHRQGCKGKLKAKIYKVDAARRALWIRDVVLAVRRVNRVPGYGQWKKRTT